MILAISTRRFAPFLKEFVSARIYLHAGHTGPSVVHDNKCHRNPVVCGIDQPGNTPMKKGGIPHRGNYRCRDTRLYEPLGNTDARAHGYFIPDRMKRRIHAENGAADVTRHHYLIFFVPRFIMAWLTAINVPRCGHPAHTPMGLATVCPVEA